MIYLITGDDSLLIENKIKDIFKNEDINQFDVSRHDGTNKKIDINLIIRECMSLPMFSNKKIVYIENPLFLTSEFSLLENDQNALIELMNNYDNSFHLVLYGNINIDKRKVLYKKMVDKIKIINIEKMKPYEFKNIVRTSLSKNNIDIKENAFEELIRRLPIDLINLRTEVNKLKMIDHQIELNDIKYLINKPMETDIFNLINALIEKKLYVAMNAWRDLRKQGNDGLGIILVLSTQVRFMFQVKYLYNKGYMESEICKILKAHPYRVELVIQRLSKYTILDLLNMLDKLAELDQNIKLGKIEANNGLELFIVQLTK